MNSNVQVLVKLEYTHSTIEDMLKRPELANIFPTLLWMRQETANVYNRIIYREEPKKRLSYLRQVMRAGKSLRALQAERELSQGEDVTEEEGILFLISALTQMLEDISQVPSMKVFMTDLITAAYTLESLIDLPRNATYEEDDVHVHAGAYLQSIYSTMNQMI